MIKSYDLPVTFEQIAAVVGQLSPADRRALLALLREPTALAAAKPPSAAAGPTDKVKLAFNGIDGTTGQPLLDVHTVAELAAWIKGEEQRQPSEEKAQLNNLQQKRQEAKGQGVRGVIQGINPLDPKQAGWGVIFHPNTPPAVRAALKPLIDHRRAQCGRDTDGLPVEFEVDLSKDVAPGSNQVDAFEFRLNRGQAAGAVNPAALPYYLLIVGPPTDVSFRFQYSMDAQHAVGRLCFDDVAGYEAYVDSVLRHEGVLLPQPPARRRRAVFFAPDSDDATQLSAYYLAGRLAEWLRVKPLSPARTPAATAPLPVYSYTAELVQADAKKNKLAAIVQDDRATLLFTASHGMGFPNSETVLQRSDQGALLCQEWPGQDFWPQGQPVPKTMYFAGEDVRQLPASARLDGLVVCSFGCYTAGTPEQSDFYHLWDHVPKEVAVEPFVGKLPQELLRRGALAFVGHVDRAWFFSYAWPGAGNQPSVIQQTDTFRSALEALLVGEPIGHALEYFQEKFLDLNSLWSEEGLVDKYDLHFAVGERMTYLWTARNDARAYILLGDPLVRLDPDRLEAA
jgi:hypothetical protein